MIKDIIAKRYAKAFILIAIQEGKILDYEKDLEIFVESIISEYSSILFSPAQNVHAKKKLLVKIIKTKNLHDITKNFLNLLVDKKRINLIYNILEEYKKMKYDCLNMVKAKIYSAKKLIKQKENECIKRLEKVLSKKVECDFLVDEDLLEGIFCKVGSKVFDNSVRTQLKLISRYGLCK